MSVSEELAYTTVVEPAGRSCSRELSPREALEATRARIAARNLPGIEGLEAAGTDLLCDHPDGIPPRSPGWLERGHGLTALAIAGDHAPRTTDGSITVGPSEVEGVEFDALVGWCPTFLIEYTGHPAPSIPAGMADRLAVGMQAVGRRDADPDVPAASAAFERPRPWQDTDSSPAGRGL